MFRRVKPLKWSSAKLAYFENWHRTLAAGAVILANQAGHSYETLAVVKSRIEIIARNCPR
jgi:hypothetical protein